VHISRVRIEGFRGIRTADIRFARYAGIIGPNGCGKSAIVDALSLVLGRTRMVRPLTEHDFTGSDPQPACRIRIIATLTGFSSANPDEHRQWFREDRAVSKWVDTHGREHASPGAGLELCVNIAFCARFDRDELETVSQRYFHDDDDIIDPFDGDDVIRSVPARLINELGYFVLPARRDWDAVASFNSDLFRRTVSNAAGIPAEEIIRQRDALRSPTDKIEESPKLKDLVKSLNDRLARLSPRCPKFQLRVGAGDSEAVLQSLLPHYALDTGHSLPASRHGAGLVSLQSILLLLEVGISRKAKGKPFILALEEPELHLAPGLAGRLVSEAKSTADQVICTTHSPEVAKVFQATEVRIVGNQHGNLAANAFLQNELTTAATSDERKIYGQNRSRVLGALMQPVALVPEGRFDAEWLGRLAELTYPDVATTPPLNAVFGVVPTENAAVVFTVQRLTTVHSRVAALVDGDEAGDGYLKKLQDCEPRPSFIVQLPPRWTIEDAICWMIEPEEKVIIPALAAELDGVTLSSLADLRALLHTTNNHKQGICGLKEDVIVHDRIIGELERSAEPRLRATKFCEALAASATGIEHPNLIKVQTGPESPPVYRFRP
jgi:putative ATP-dependent endonuclease of the OLD family